MSQWASCQLEKTQNWNPPPLPPPTYLIPTPLSVVWSSAASSLVASGVSQSAAFHHCPVHQIPTVQLPSDHVTRATLLTPASRTFVLGESQWVSAQVGKTEYLWHKGPNCIGVTIAGWVPYVWELWHRQESAQKTRTFVLGESQWVSARVGKTEYLWHKGPNCIEWL